MGYAKICHSILIDPLAESLSDAEMGLLVRLTVWCSEQESDGRFTVESVSRRCLRRGSMRSLQRLVDVGLLSIEGQLTVGSTSSHGRVYVISRYLDTNTHSSAIQAKRAAEAARKAVQRLRVPVGHRATLVQSTENRVQRTENKEQRTENKQTRARRKKPATGFPVDWAPSPRHMELAVALGLSATAERASFESSALAHGRTYSDWDAAFDNWLRSPYRRRKAFSAFDRVAQNERQEMIPL